MPAFFNYKNVLNFFNRNSSFYIIISLGLFIRIVSLIWLSNFPLVSDALSYHEVAVQLVNNETFIPYWPPGLPYFLSFFYGIFGVNEIISRISMLLFYILLSVFIYLLTKEVSDRKSANFAVFIFTLYPTYIHLSIEPLTQLPVAVYLVAITYLIILMCKNDSFSYSLLVGLLTGIVILTRPSSIFLLIFIPFYIFIKTRKILIALLPIIISLFIISIWILKIYNMNGQFVFINYTNSENIFIGNNPYTPLYKTWWFGSHKPGEVGVPDEYVRMLRQIKSEPEYIQDKLFQKVVIEHILNRPDLFFIRTLNRIRTYFSFDTFSGAMIIKNYKMSKIFGLMVIAIDIIFYFLVMIFFILLIFNFTNLLVKPDYTYIIVGVALIYAFPYWLTFSHPVYHFPTVPLFGILSISLISGFMDKKNDENKFINLFGKKKYVILFTVIFFIYIQIEWFLIMYSQL
jgi:4-amino-4-deoxy-L-arabinose transferase-like glycosyltransferase